jgi:hypothetical protein
MNAKLSDEDYAMFVEQARMLIERGYVTGMTLEELIKRLKELKGIK